MPPNSYTTAHSQDSNLPTLPKDSAIIQPYLRGLRIYVHVYKNFLYVILFKELC